MPLYGDGDLITIKFIQALVACPYCHPLTGNRSLHMGYLVSREASQRTSWPGLNEFLLSGRSLWDAMFVHWTHSLVVWPSAYDYTLYRSHTLSSGVRIGGGFRKFEPLYEYLLWGHCQWGVLVVPPPAPLTAVAVVATATLVVGLSPGFSVTCCLSTFLQSRRRLLLE
ncbi:hypothetical protein Tco_1303908 [Tanacetum coccineum]